MYEFTQDCLTGIDQIDEEHRKLFSLINEAVELPKEARTPQTVKNILEHLSDYAVNHFAHEEAYMEAQNDPELPLQKKEHQAFADHVKLLEKQPLTGENASAMLDEILTYLVRWLYRHILSSDMMIGKMQKEDPFVFTAKYYTGIELVDREHRKLFEIIGEVNALIHNDLLHDKYDEIVRLLDELREYTKFHFEDEEAYMQVEPEFQQKVQFLSREKLLAMTGEEKNTFFRNLRADLPMYISVDKDVLCTADASTTWSQGDMSLEKLQKFLEIVLQQQQILGMDICGECDPDACERNLLNDRANQKLLELWKKYFPQIRERRQDI